MKTSLQPGQQTSQLLPLGVGIGIGALSIWALVELFPLIVVGGAGYLMIKGLNQSTKKVQSWQENG